IQKRGYRKQMNDRYPLLCYLQILFDNAGDNAESNVSFFIEESHGKADIILLTGHTSVHTGMSNGIDTIGQPDIDYTFMYIGDFTGILSLDFAQLQAAFLLLRNTFDISFHSDVFHIFSCYFPDADKNRITD